MIPTPRILLLLAVSLALFSLALFSPTVGGAQEPDPDPGDRTMLDDVVLRPGDVLEVLIWREEDLSGEFVVDRDGVVTLPLLGRREVTGEPWRSVHDGLLEAYGRELRNPSVIVTPLRRVYVLGHVNTPGLYPVDPTVSLAGVIAMAGGADQEGDLTKVQVIREGEVLIDEVSVASALESVDVQSGDQIFVGRRSWFERNSTFLVSATLSVASILITLLR